MRTYACIHNAEIRIKKKSESSQNSIRRGGKSLLYNIVYVYIIHSIDKKKKTRVYYSSETAKW